MNNPKLNRDEMLELKGLLAERMVDNMTTQELAEYVQDDLFKYFDKQDEHDFLEDARNYWDDGFDEIISEVKEIVVLANVLPLN